MLGLPVSSAALALLGATLTGPTTPVASLPDPCDSSSRYTGVGIIGTVIATDGVVRLHATRRVSAPADVEETLPFIIVNFTDATVMPVEGALEYQADLDTIVWRPAAPLDPLADYNVDVYIDNDALSLALDHEGIAGDDSCGDNLHTNADLLTAEGTLAPLAPPDPMVESSHQVTPREHLGAMVCCDGAYPVLFTNGFDFEPEVQWDEGHCATTEAHGEVRATESFSDTDFPLHVINDLVLRLTQADGYPVGYANPGQLSAWIEDDEPLCAAMEAFSLATGDSWTGPEHCYGDDLVDQLGVHEIDPSESLAVCSGQPYTCAIEDGAWVPDDCTPWEPPSGADSGGSDDGADGGSGGPDGGDGAGDGADGGSGGPDGGDDTAGQDDGGGLNDLGCGCRTQSDAPASLWFLMAGLFGWRRRRMNSAVAPRRCG